MRLGYGEYYDGKDEENSARQYARHYYFNVVLENEPELLESLRQEAYPVFRSFLREPMPPVPIWLALEVSARLAKLLEEIPLEVQNQHKDRTELVRETISLTCGGTPEDALSLYRVLTQWRNQESLAKLGEWVPEVAYRYLGHWADVGASPSQAKLCTPEEMIGADRNGLSFSATAYGNSGKSDEFPTFAFKLLSGFYGKDSFLQRLIDLGDDNGNAWLFDSESSEYVSWFYTPSIRTRAEEKKRIMDAFGASLDHYFDACDEVAKSKGYLKVKDRRKRIAEPTERFQWLYQRHIYGLTYPRIANDATAPVTEEAVRAAVEETADLVGVNLT